MLTKQFIGLRKVKSENLKKKLGQIFKIEMLKISSQNLWIENQS